MTRILLVDDDTELLETLTACLTLEKYSVEVAKDGIDGKQFLLTSTFDLIILDWTLPEISGIDLCKAFRKQGGVTPILFLTGKNDIVDKEEGLDAGGDDYLTKPFHVRELLARVRALLRRPAIIQGETLSAGGIELDTRQHSATLRGAALTLTPKEFALLEIFMRHPNQVFTPDKLLDLVWANDVDKSIDVVRQCVSRLRHAIGDKKNNSLIRSIYGVGYRLEM